MSDRVVQLHRVIKAPPERVYRAFLDAEAWCKWVPPAGFIGTVHQFEAQVGGRFRMSFRSFASGQVHAFGGEYLELVPNERIRYTDRFDDPNLPGTMEVTVQLAAVMCGTDLRIEQAGIPDVVPLEMCYLGWQESLLQLAMLVEPNITG